MNKSLVFSIDTESDQINVEKNSIHSINGIKFIQNLTQQYGFSPTYLLTYEMATKKDAVFIIKPYLESGECEIGHHLHVWTTPPFENANAYGVEEKLIDGFQSELPDNVLIEKLDTLHNAIIENYGVIPKIHRAGRWAVDARTIEWLISKGYEIETSVCSGVSYKNVKGVREKFPFCSLNSPNMPYFVTETDFYKQTSISSNKKILEIPVTGVDGDWLWHYNIRGQDKIRSVLWRAGYKGTYGFSLRPSYDIPLNIFEHSLYKIFSSSLTFFHVMVHSYELVEGCSYKSHTHAKTERIKQRLKMIFEMAHKFGIKGIKMSETLDIFQEGNR